MRYYQATCEQYTGTWQGYLTDPSDLFGDGGPWPVTMYLYQKDGYLIGRSTAITADKHHDILPAKKIWAKCQDGVLSQINWGEKGECGATSEQGMLVSQHMLLLKLQWENAMNGATFYAFLHRINQTYPFKLPVENDAYHYGKRDTCH